MHLLSNIMIAAQTLSAQDITLEMERLNRNFTFLCYGFTAAWVILVVYVLMMTSREAKLKREIASLRAMLDDRPRG